LNDFKSILQSRTVWSCLLVLASLGLEKFGYTFTAADQADLVNYIAGAGETIGAVLAIVYRVKATKAIV